MAIKKSLSAKIAILIVVTGMSFFPIYSSFYKAYAVEQYERHQAHLQKNSMFFNPWQYRVLCPFIVEGMYWVADHTLFSLVEIKGVTLNLPGDDANRNPNTQKLIEHLKNPDYIKYNIVFVAFRFIQNIVLIILCYHFFNYFSRGNELLSALGIMLAFLFMGNGVMDADYTFNTYMDITLYLLACMVIIHKKSPAWIVLLTAIGATNRETSMFIPVLYFFSEFSWKEWPSVPQLIQKNFRVLIYSVLSTVLFLGIIFSIRAFYGYQPVSSWRVGIGLPMLKLNLFSAVSVKSYMEMFGVFGFLPVLTILYFRKLSSTLKLFFLCLVPCWFAIHFATAITYQTRLFLVPTIIVFIPAMIELINQSFQEKKSLQTVKEEVL